MSNFRLHGAHPARLSHPMKSHTASWHTLGHHPGPKPSHPKRRHKYPFEGTTIPIKGHQHEAQSLVISSQNCGPGIRPIMMHQSTPCAGTHRTRPCQDVKSALHNEHPTQLLVDTQGKIVRPGRPRRKPRQAYTEHHGDTNQ